MPTCRAPTPLDFEHIRDWSIVKEHKFDNMVVLCTSCHARVTRNEIHKDAIRGYKRNLSIISDRYSLYEFRLIEVFYQEGVSKNRTFVAPISEHDLLHVKGLLDDGLIGVQATGTGMKFGGLSITAVHATLTQSGIEFVRNYFSGEAIGA